MRRSTAVSFLILSALATGGCVNPWAPPPAPLGPGQVTAFAGDASQADGVRNNSAGLISTFRITRLRAEPATLDVTPGQVVRLRAETSAPQGRVEWLAGRGDLTPEADGASTWRAPTGEGPVTIRVTVHAAAADSDTADGLLTFNVLAPSTR